MMKLFHLDQCFSKCGACFPGGAGWGGGTTGVVEKRETFVESVLQNGFLKFNIRNLNVTTVIVIFISYC